MISKKAVLLGGLSLLIGTASVAAAKEAICSEQIMPTVLTAQKRHRTGGSVMAASIGILLLPFLLNLPYCFKNAARTLILK